MFDRNFPVSMQHHWFVFLVLVPSWLCFHLVPAQETQDVHPWLADCDQYDCFMGYYCNYESLVCEPCPPNDENGADSDAQVLADVCNGVVGSNGTNSTTATQTKESCKEWCVRSQQGYSCSASNPCQEGKSFCDSQEEGGTGTCQACPSNVTDCLTIPLLSDYSVEECLLCDLKCVPLHFSNMTIGDDSSQQLVVPSNALQGSPPLTALGPLIDCSNVIHDTESTCQANATGKVCLVEEYTRSAYYVDVVNKCASSGGIAVILFGDFEPETPNDVAWTGSLSFIATSIPSVSISYNDGIHLRGNMTSRPDLLAQVSVSNVGEYCEKRQFCSDTIPCVGSNEGRYCDYKWTPDQEGFCRDCPVDENENPAPLGCFFNITGGDLGKVTGQKAVESCSEVCATSLEFGDCKLCPENVNGFDFGVESGAKQCSLCPENDLALPRQAFPLFGEGIECWQVQKFFESVEVSDSSPNCRLAQMMNYICGCAGPGYGGAATETKRVVLAWLPRVMALLSFIGSCFVLYDASRTKEKRQKLLYQLLMLLSSCDIIGSCAYALTTLPIPDDDVIPVYGAKGNDATCIAQGFFIQIGTISCYTNVSLSIYYLLAIKFGQSERQLKQKRVWLMFCPVLIGLALAFAGIPFYGNQILWCNNTASWWPEIPVLLAIVIATIVMASVCWDVYWKEKASAKWRMRGAGGARNGLSMQVFWQSFWCLMAFYLTWPTYLALQYSWAADNYFISYGLLLTAGMMVPLQGFWNAFVYTRPRHLKGVGTSARRASTLFVGRLRTSQTTSERSLMRRSLLARFRIGVSSAASSRNPTESSRNSPGPSEEPPSTEDGNGVNFSTETAGSAIPHDEAGVLSQSCESSVNDESADASTQTSTRVSFIDSRLSPSTPVEPDCSVNVGGGAYEDKDRLTCDGTAGVDHGVEP